MPTKEERIIRPSLFACRLWKGALILPEMFKTARNKGVFLMAGKIGRSLVGFSVTLVLLLAWMPEGKAGDGAHVLVIHSYHQGFQWTDGITAGIQSVFGGKIPQAMLDIQYMDTRRHPVEETLYPLYQWYGGKYRNHQPDVIVVSDDDAFDFLLMYRNQLFPGVPVVFCGLNDFSEERVAGHRGITGVVEDLDFKSTIAAALRLHPEKQQIAVVSDSTTTGYINSLRLRKIMHDFQPRVKFIELAGLSAPALRPGSGRSIHLLLGGIGDP